MCLRDAMSALILQESSSDPASMPSLWFEGGNINIAAGYEIDGTWNLVRDGGNPVPTATGGNISFNGDSAVYIGNTAAPYNNGLTLQAHGNIDLRVLETYGPVSITSTLATAPVINLWNPIGPHLVDTVAPIEPLPPDLGVASFALNSPAAGTTVNMQGVRAEGDVSISIGGTLNSARNITSTSGSCEHQRSCPEHQCG